MKRTDLSVESKYCVFITQLAKTHRLFTRNVITWLSSPDTQSLPLSGEREEKKRARESNAEQRRIRTPVRQSPSPYWRHVRDSRRASPWKRSHPGGGLYSNRAGESRTRRGATSSRNKYVSPSRPRGPHIPVRPRAPARWRETGPTCGY